MGRQIIPVDKAILIASISEVEASGALALQSDLWAKVADVYNSKVVPAPISWSMVANKVKELEIVTLTKPGKRGRKGPLTAEHKAAFLGARGPRSSRAKKFAKNPEIGKAFDIQRKRTPVRLHVLIDRAEKGSLKAAVKLMCHACMGHEHAPEGIRNCTSLGCPLYAFRPHQKVGDDDVVGVVGADDVSGEAA